MHRLSRAEKTAPPLCHTFRRTHGTAGSDGGLRVCVCMYCGECGWNLISASHGSGRIEKEAVGYCVVTFSG